MHRPLSSNPSKLRYVTYIFLCTLTVAVAETLPPWAVLLCCSVGSDCITLLLSLFSVEKPSQCYSTLLSMALAILRYPSIAIQHDMDPGGSRTQHSTLLSMALAILRNPSIAIQHDMDPDGSRTQRLVIHFALAFVVLSEVEFYRSYITHRRINFSLVTWWIEYMDDPFEESREAFGYWNWNPRGPLRPPTGWISMQCVKNVSAVALDALLFALWFWTSGWLNSQVKRGVIPDLPGLQMPLFGPRDVLYTADTPEKFAFQFMLLRPVRLLNRMVFWTCVESAQRLWKREKREEKRLVPRNRRTLRRKKLM